MKIIILDIIFKIGLILILSGLIWAVMVSPFDIQSKMILVGLILSSSTLVIAYIETEV